ncbi:hypothetical protein [Victivallis lenta]|uniref:hypothetical protein n=2 Tax=Victivallis lenta TaxID=2606640 RepID=UPI000E842900|nr:hypothetical protein [Lentisphaeria bacterium]
MIEPFLEELENRLDPQTEEALEAEWNRFLDRRFDGGIFRPRRRAAAPARLEWPSILINHALRDPELLLLRELRSVSDTLAAGSGNLLNIRCNYGTSILPSLFGVEPFYLDDDCDTLPTSMPLADGRDGIRRLVDAGVPPLDRGLAPKVFDTAAFFRARLEPYPKLREYVRLYHPDLQGTADVAEVVWGSGIFMEFYDDPALIRAFFELITAAYREFMDRWEREFPPLSDRFRCHWGWGHRGKIVLRDDSAMNLSPDMYAEFVLPFDRALLERYGGGVVHFCGRGDHYIDLLAGVPELTGIQLSQPECNDMEKIYRHTVDRGIPLFGLPLEAAEQALACGRPLHGLVHCC